MHVPVSPHYREKAAGFDSEIQTLGHTQIVARTLPHDARRITHNRRGAQCIRVVSRSGLMRPGFHDGTRHRQESGPPDCTRETPPRATLIRRVVSV